MSRSALAKLSDADLVQFTTNIINVMTGNANYATPFPTLADMTAANDTFDNAVTAALDGGKTLIAMRNAKREALLTLLRNLAAYVTGNCQGDVVTLLTSGFEAIKTPSPIGVLSAPDNPRLDYTGMSGQLLFRFKGDKNARNYSIECSQSVDGPWEDKGLSTTTRVMIDSLIPGKTYWARSAANGAAGPSGWSNPVPMMAV